jgi:vesicle coat complex subunit
MDADDLVKNVPYELDINIIDKDLQHTDDFIACVALFVSCSVLDKIPVS